MPQRKMISDVQRKALRDWANSQSSRPTQKACIAWFFAHFNHRLSQSTVSDILSSRYQYLDSEIYPSIAHRKGTPYWRDLEEILYQWQSTLDRRGAYISGEILIEKAHQIWRSLPQYRDQPPPAFSNGWLHRFKQRYNIKQYTLHGEANSVPKEAEDQMKGIRTITGQYNEEDMYNMDESGLFWRNPPSKSLSSFQRPGVKNHKSRISIICCVNASGTDRFPIWIIGHSRTPRALRNINISTLGAVWRWNKKAWMDPIIMREWLLAFYQSIGTQRSVLLTMDNLSAHLSGLELAPPPPNIRVCWLPKNSISRYQPLDQGIIQNLKVYYRKQWLRYMLYHYEQGLNPLDYVTLLDSIRWLVRAWYHDVLSSTITACFYKSTLVYDPVQLPVEAPNLAPLYTQVQQSGRLVDCMEISYFLNPIEEDLEAEDTECEPEALRNQPITQSSETIEASNTEEEDSPEPPPLPTRPEALSAVQLLISYIEGQDILRASFLRSLERFERDLEGEIATLKHYGVEYAR